jgi:hypothetical protein
MNQTQVTHSHIPPVKGLHQMLRSSGYDFEDCILEFTDNSKDAKATEVDVCLFTNTTDENLERLVILDYNGKGMNYQELLEGITIAQTRLHTNSDIGFYGFGLNSASLNIGNELIVLSKTPSADKFIGARIDFAAQERANSYAPTRVSTNAKEDLFEYIPSSLISLLEEFEGSNNSCTLIQVSRPHIQYASMSCKSLRDRIVNRLKVAYTENDNFNMNVIIYSEDNDDEVNVTPQDMFYHKEPNKLRKPSVKVNLFALIPQRETDGIVVYECNTQKRSILKNKKITETNGTLERHIWYNVSSENMTSVQDPFANPSNLPYGIKEIIPFSMELVFVKNETFANEPEDRRAKGIWFQRGPRIVAQSLTLGIHGINAHGHYNQMRAIVKYPATLDRHFGSRYNKALNPKSGPLKDAIIRIWKDQTSAWVKMKEAERRPAPRPSPPRPGPFPELPVSPTPPADDVASNDSLNEAASDVESEEESRQTRLDTHVTIQPIQSLKQVIIKDNKIVLVQGDEEVAEVDGLKQNSHLKPYIERCLKMKGFQKTRDLMKAMDQILSTN